MSWTEGTEKVSDRMSEPGMHGMDGHPVRNRDTLSSALKPFGWTCTEDFWQRYHSDPWVFNLANAVERLTERLDAAIKALASAEREQE